MDTLIVSNLKKTFGTHVVLENIDFNIPAGSFTGVLGPNGSGKTTIMKCIAGLIPIDSGEIKIQGADIKNRKIAYTHTTFIIGNPIFPPKQTPNDILRYIGSCHRMSQEEIRIRTEYCLEQVHMSKWANKPIGSFSKGMTQRIAIAQALLPDPDLIIMDEPTSGLDPRGMVEIRELLRSLKDGKRSMLISSHILDDVKDVCDDVMLMRDGHIVKNGHIEDLLQDLVGTHYLIKTSLPLNEQVLGDISAIPSVISLEIISPTEISVAYNSPETNTIVSEMIVKSGSGLISIEKNVSGLENLYLSFTDSGDVA